MLIATSVKNFSNVQDGHLFNKNPQSGVTYNNNHTSGCPKVTTIARYVPLAVMADL